MLTRTVVAACAAAATVGLLVAGARVLARVAEDLDAFADAVNDELQAAVDGPAAAGTDWTWLTGHTDPPRDPDDDIEALARSLNAPCDRHWMIADNGMRVDLPVITCPQCVRSFYTTGQDAC